MGRGSII